MRGMVQTVLGPVSPEILGPTTAHEHLLLDFSVVFQEPEAASERGLAFQPVDLDILAWTRYDPFRSRDNLMLVDEDTTVEEAMLFRAAGGRTIVDTTTRGIGRDPAAAARISRRTGINVVIGSGYYVGASHPAGMDAKSEDEIAAEIVADVTTGQRGVKAGVIGELGCSWPLWPNERKVLKAGARAQVETGASIIIHPGRSEDAPFEILDVLSGAGADVKRVVIGHLGRTYFNASRLLELARTGCYLAYDQLGWETSNFSLAATDFPSDAQRIGFVKLLVDEGHGGQVLLGQDVCSKDKLVRYGGHGFAHLLDNIAPRLVEAGISQHDVDRMLISNPAEMLTIA